MTTDPDIRIADQHHRAGRRAEAGRICRQVLSRQPDNPDALHLLGIVLAQSGDLDDGVEQILRAVELRPSFAAAWANLGTVLVNQGKLTEAIAAYTRLTELTPDDAAAHYGLGILLRDAGRLDDAIARFSRAVQLKPRYVEALFKLGMALRSKGRLDDAIATYQKVIALKPDFADAHNNLANVLRDKRLLDEAIAGYTRAVRLNPNDVVAHVNLGNAFSHKEQFAEAVAAYRRAIRLNGDCFEAHNQMGLALANLQQYDEALASHSRALALRPNEPVAHETLGASLLLKHDMPAAEASFRRALALDPDAAKSWNGLGMALQALGRFDEASDCFRRAVAISPDTAFFHKNLATTTRQNVDPAEVERLNRLLDRPDLPVNERVDAGFALGKLLDDSDRFDEAFASYAKANLLFRESRAEAGKRYDGDRIRRTVDQLIANFTPDFFARRQGWGDPSELPVLIVGMPRSGTTLVEQIAASHPSVFGAGELQDVERLYSTVTRNPDHGSGGDWEPQSVARAAAAYLAHLRSLGPAAQRVTDKMPGNLFHLGLIAVLFPRARVVLCRRDGRDNCLSCYFQQFGKKDSHLYGYDLADCGHQFLQAHRLMDHWLKALPLRMLEMHYEQLVADQERQTRRLIDFLGLPWDPACLEFHKTERAVVTASVWQVRQPMYNRSVGRWRHYERHLGPLLDVLGRPGGRPA